MDIFKCKWSALVERFKHVYTASHPHTAMQLAYPLGAITLSCLKALWHDKKRLESNHWSKFCELLLQKVKVLHNRDKAHCSEKVDWMLMKQFVTPGFGLWPTELSDDSKLRPTLNWPEVCEIRHCSPYYSTELIIVIFFFKVATIGFFNSLNLLLICYCVICNIILKVVEK